MPLGLDKIGVVEMRFRVPGIRYLISHEPYNDPGYPHVYPCHEVTTPSKQGLGCSAGMIPTLEIPT